MPLFMVNIVEHLVQQGLVMRRAGQWTLRDGRGGRAPRGLTAVAAAAYRSPRTRGAPGAGGGQCGGRRVCGGGGSRGGRQCPVEDVETICEALGTQRALYRRHRAVRLAGWTRRGELSVSPCAVSAGAVRAVWGRCGAAQLHGRIGARLEAGYGAQAGEIATQLAVHFERGGEVQRAVHYLQQAGEHATRRNAYHEAVAALTKGLALLATLPDSPERTQHELTLLLTLGEHSDGGQGQWRLPEVGEVYTRAHALCQQMGEPPQRFRALWGLVQFHMCPGAVARRGRVESATLAPGAAQGDPVLVLEGYMAVGGGRLLSWRPGHGPGAPGAQSAPLRHPACPYPLLLRRV